MSTGNWVSTTLNAYSYTRCPAHQYGALERKCETSLSFTTPTYTHCTNAIPKIPSIEVLFTFLFLNDKAIELTEIQYGTLSYALLQYFGVKYDKFWIIDGDTARSLTNNFTIYIDTDSSSVEGLKNRVASYSYNQISQYLTGVNLDISKSSMEYLKVIEIVQDVKKSDTGAKVGSGIGGFALGAVVVVVGSLFLYFLNKKMPTNKPAPVQKRELNVPKEPVTKPVEEKTAEDDDDEVKVTVE